MSSRKPYTGSHRKLVVGIDVGTTFSGVSFTILDPGKAPVIQGVNRYPAQEKVGGDTKIPSIIYYDLKGAVRAVGAEALLESNAELAQDEDWVKVEWFKLHLRPLSAVSPTDEPLPPLPPNKTIVQVFGDFLRYLYECTRVYIQETHASGRELWASLAGHAEFVLTHPNGWEGTQQAQMRKAAIHAGLIPDHLDEYSRIQFVTEGEASLHYCIGNGYASDVLKSGQGVIIVDAGGGTIDLSAYYMKKAPALFEEIAPTMCLFQGSIFVTRRARKFLENKLYYSRFGGPDDISYVTECFEKSTKLGFRDPSQPAFVKFGTSRDTDPSVDIKMGQLKLKGLDVAALFEPCLAAIQDAITQQKRAAIIPVTSVMLVGGFAASDWLFSNLQTHLEGVNLRFSRPDGHLGKAVADGAVSFQIDHYVTMRVARTTFGAECSVTFDKSNFQHLRRSHTILTWPSGSKLVPDAFDVILPKGTRVSETTEFRRPYSNESVVSSEFKSVSADIFAYRGQDPSPQWIDIEPDMYSVLCTVTADTSQMIRTLNARIGENGNTYYHIDYSIVLLFGLTEHRAQLCWMEDGQEKRSPATIVYDQGVGRA